MNFPRLTIYYDMKPIINEKIYRNYYNARYDSDEEISVNIKPSTYRTNLSIRNMR